MSLYAINIQKVIFKKYRKSAKSHCKGSISMNAQQIRTKYANRWMIRDVKRRICVKEHAEERLRVNSLRKNDILPIELREIADKEIDAFPRDSCKRRIVGRCSITSRPRGNVVRWRLSRIVWRDLADHNRISGVQRARW